MSRPTNAAMPWLVRRGARATRIAAIVVLLSLAALASYALFSGPTRVPAGGPQTVPAKPAPAPFGEEGDGGGRGGERGD